MLTLTQNDTAPTLEMSVNANLTGATVVAHFRKPDGTLVDKAVTVGPVDPDAPSSALTMPWETGDLALTSRHLVEVQVTYSDGKIQTFGPAVVNVKSELA